MFSSLASVLSSIISLATFCASTFLWLMPPFHTVQFMFMPYELLTVVLGVVTISPSTSR